MILILGGAGYIGSHTNKELNKKGFQTVVYDNLIYGHRDFVKWGAFEEGDIGDAGRLEEVFLKYKITSVMHFAAYTYVGESVTNPSKYYSNNVVNMLVLLEVMRKHGVKDIIFSSTCATYGTPKTIPITENMLQKPINPYGASKLMAERILSDYHQAYGLKYVCFRYFNAAGADPDTEIGEDHRPETHLIPLALDAACGRREVINVFGLDYPTPDGSCIRDYVHVSDIASAHILALSYLENQKKSDYFNLGSGKGYSVLDVIKATEKVTKQNCNVNYLSRRPGDSPILTCSTDKANNLLGWKPIYSDIETIIGHAWEWHKKRFC